MHHIADVQSCSDRQLSPCVGPEALLLSALSGGNIVIQPYFLILVSSCLSSVVVPETDSII